MGLIFEISTILTVCAVAGVSIWFFFFRTPKDTDCPPEPKPELSEEELAYIEREAKQVKTSAEVIESRVERLRQASDLRESKIRHERNRKA